MHPNLRVLPPGVMKKVFAFYSGYGMIDKNHMSPDSGEVKGKLDTGFPFCRNRDRHREKEHMNIIKQKATVLSNEMISPGIYDMWLENHAISLLAKPGQFLSVYCDDESRLLPRPISICEIDSSRSALRIVFRVAGKGTEEFSEKCKGDYLDVMGPLGNGYRLPEPGSENGKQEPSQNDKESTNGQHALLIGGGIGIPPLLELAKQCTCKKTIILGFRDKTFLLDDFQKYGTVIIASEDGSIGTKGNVLDAIRENQIRGDIIYSCGPIPMLKGIKQYAEESGIPAQISLEERMACGIGACLACVCKSGHTDEHTNVKNKRICKEGPVFMASEVEL